ncbi:MAG: hypothetical protein FJ034_00520 [Chloroflexi bacterium]|nr:hypothetical protein [Chloroflexota bacterium]
MALVYSCTIERRWVVWILILFVGAGVVLGGLRRVLPPPVSAADLVVSVVPEPGPSDPKLVGLRDSLISHLVANLPAAWSKATRGLGALRIDQDNPAVVIRVAAAVGTPSFTSARFQRDEVLIFAADGVGALTPRDTISITLQQLGYHWCCTGEGTLNGRWATPISEGALVGLNEFGLMSGPLKCVAPRGGGEPLCPNVFSERELATMGFTGIPKATPNPCAVQTTELEAQVASTKESLSAIEQRVKSMADRVIEAERVIRSITLVGLPEEEYQRYLRLVDGYNDLVREQNALISAQVAQATAHKALVVRLAATQPCP